MTEHMIDAIMLGIILILAIAVPLVYRAAAHRKQWCVRQLMDDGPWHYWKTIAGSITKAEALIPVEQLQAD